MVIIISILVTVKQSTKRTIARKGGTIDGKMHHMRCIFLLVEGLL